MKVVKTIGVRLKPTPDQITEFETLFLSFQKGINWSLYEIEKRYQIFLKNYSLIPKDQRIVGICASCGSEKNLSYTSTKDPDTKHCTFCAMKTYSEYTIRKEIYSTKERVVEHDLKDVVDIPNKTHYGRLFGQAYTIWKSYNDRRSKRLWECETIENEIAEYPNKQYLKAAMSIEQLTSEIKNKNLDYTWRVAQTQATRQVYLRFSKDEQEEIKNIHNKLMDLKRLKNQHIDFPQVKHNRSITMYNMFVKWQDSVLYMTLFSKGQTKVEYFGKEYLKQFIPSMEENRPYCTLNKKSDQYYLLYPLTIELPDPKDINERDAFVFMTSPTKTAIVRYDASRVFKSVKWFETGNLVFSKRKFMDKRAQMTKLKSPDEKRRKLRRRLRKIYNRGNLEERFVSTYNHQLTRSMVDYIMDQTDKPKIVVWDVGNGIKQNFGGKLNHLKSLWPAVQQQKYLQHKAMQLGIPVIELKYNTCNDLICSACGEKQMNKNRPVKVITELIRGTKNFKCSACGHETNMLINQANNVRLQT
ncbi:MAG: hypothetical protein Q7J10_08960 [Methanosarcinaceae archaeon]|nr:hypothetical protein [Methanosarcinaceae archaeon]